VITGVVTSSREAVLSLILSAADNAGVEVEAVIDTGFDGFLTQPARLIGVSVPCGVVWSGPTSRT